MRRKLLIVVAVLALVLVAVTPVAAITGGQPDGDEHPYGALLLAPGWTFCSGTLIAPDVVLTAGHCTSYWTEDPDDMIDEVWVTFDSEAAVDPATWEITGGTWYLAESWVTHPDYVDADWPFTRDYGLVFLEESVVGITPAVLPESGVLTELIGEHGQTNMRFNDVGYGQDGVSVGGGPPLWNYEFVRKVSEQRYNPSQGAVGTQDPTWFILGNAPSDNHGGGCGGDSGSGIFPAEGEDANTVLAVHTGGYRMGNLGQICGRITSLNHRVDIDVVLDWIESLLD